MIKALINPQRGGYKTTKNTYNRPYVLCEHNSVHPFQTDISLYTREFYSKLSVRSRTFLCIYLKKNSSYIWTYTIIYL